MTMPRIFLYLILLLFFACLTACESGFQPSEQQQTDPSANEYRFTKGGAPVELIVRLSESTIDLSELLMVTIEVQFKEGVQVLPPYLSESVYEPLVLVKPPKNETVWSEKRQRMIHRWSYTFEPWSSGNFSLKPFSIHFRLDSEKSDDLSKWPVYAISSESIAYSVTAITTEELDDIKPIKGMVYPPYRYWIPVTAALAVIAIGIVAYGLIRIREGRTPGLETTGPSIDNYAEALSRLDTLEQKQLVEQSAFNAFHTELSTILRDYLEKHLGLKAREQTTQEFVQDIVDRRRFTSSQRRELEAYLELADLVKFASFQPGSDISLNALNSVRSFIQSTGQPNDV